MGAFLSEVQRACHQLWFGQKGVRPIRPSPSPWRTQGGISSRYNGNCSLQASTGDLVIRGDGQFIERRDPKATDPKKAVLWRRNWFASSDAIAIAKNAVVVAGQMEDVTQARKIVPAMLALNLKDGSVLWSHRLPHRVASWGLAVTREGSLVITMPNGDVACLAGN